MTHDELLFKIYEIHNNSSDAGQKANKQYRGMIHFMQALRAVVELHKDNGYGSCDICADPNTGHLGVMALYPCPTIQAIEEQLK